MKKKFILISPVLFYSGKQKPEMIKYHLLSIMSHLDEFVDVKIIDFDVLLNNQKSAEDIESFNRKAEEIIGNETFDYVGISCYTSFHYMCTLSLLKICNKINPKAILIIGGYHPTALAEDFIDDSIPVDYIVRGEGEESLAEIVCNTSERPKKTTVINGKLLNLSNAKRVLHEQYPYKTGDISIPLSRGCFYKCSFCVQSHDYPNKLRHYSIERVMEEIDNACRYLPVESIMFIDSFFGVNKRYTLLLLEELKRKFNHLTFWAETRVDNVTEDLVKGIKGLKFELHLGVESLANKTLELMNKTKNPDKYIDCFHKAIRLCNAHNINTRCGFIANYPGEDVKSHYQTLHQIEQAIDPYTYSSVWINFNLFRLYPGNALYSQKEELADKYGFKSNNKQWWKKEGGDMIQNASDCICSSDVMREFGYAPKFWTKDVLGLKERFSSKFTYSAYTHFCRDEIMSSLKQCYSDRRHNYWSSWEYKDQIELLSRFRFGFKDHFYLYKKLLTKNYLEILPFFIKIFEKTVFDLQLQLIKDYDNTNDTQKQLKEIDRILTVFENDKEVNVKNIKKGKGALPIKISLNNMSFIIQKNEKNTINVFNTSNIKWKN